MSCAGGGAESGWGESSAVDAVTVLQGYLMLKHRAEVPFANGLEQCFSKKCNQIQKSGSTSITDMGTVKITVA